MKGTRGLAYLQPTYSFLATGVMTLRILQRAVMSCILQLLYFYKRNLYLSFVFWFQCIFYYSAKSEISCSINYFQVSKFDYNFASSMCGILKRSWSECIGLWQPVMTRAQLYLSSVHCSTRDVLFQNGDIVNWDIINLTHSFLSPSKHFCNRK